MRPRACHSKIAKQEVGDENAGNASQEISAQTTKGAGLVMRAARTAGRLAPRDGRRGEKKCFRNIARNLSDNDLKITALCYYPK